MSTSRRRTMKKKFLVASLFVFCFSVFLGPLISKLTNDNNLE